MHKLIFLVIDSHNNIVGIFKDKDTAVLYRDTKNKDDKELIESLPDLQSGLYRTYYTLHLVPTDLF